MKNALAALTATGLWLSLLALPAQAAEGFYVRMDAGVSSPEQLSGDYPLKASGLGGQTRATGIADLGGGISFAALGLNLRAEAVASLRENAHLSATDYVGISTLSARSTLGQALLLANILADFEAPYNIRLFAGAGAGAARNRVSAIDLRLNNTQLTLEQSHIKTGLAWNVLAGFSVPLTRSVTLDLTYRYLDAGEFQSSGKDLQFGNLPSVKSRFTANEALLGVRILL